jgi:hypothetical protein
MSLVRKKAKTKAEKLADEALYQKLFFTVKGVRFKRIGVAVKGKGYETIRNLESRNTSDIEIGKLMEILANHSEV